MKEKGRFMYYADSAGYVTFILYNKVKGKKVQMGSFLYPVRNGFPPTDDLTIGGHKEGQIQKQRLEVQQGVASYYDWSKWGIACLAGVKPVLQSCRLIIMRKDLFVFSIEIIGS